MWLHHDVASIILVLAEHHVENRRRYTGPVSKRRRIVEAILADADLAALEPEAPQRTLTELRIGSESLGELKEPSALVGVGDL